MSHPKRSLQDHKNLISLGSNIRQWREERGLTQEQFASMVGFSRSYITEIESGKRNISYLNLVKIIEELGITEAEIGNLLERIDKRRSRTPESGSQL